MRFGVDHLADRLGRLWRQRNLAFTAIAASPAFLTEMVVARVFGATRTNPRGFFTANTALKGHILFFLFGV